MTTEIYVIAGFLGAGKTTLIQKLLKEAFNNHKVVLIENDFGDISVDAALLKSGSIQVKEINSGCICCSLSGDLLLALKEILDRYQPDKILIEPSGVGKLSDIITVCSDPQITPLAKIKTTITVVDVKRCHTYLDNFGEFFEDQIHYADTVLFSRTEDSPGKTGNALKLVKDLNSHGAILSSPWTQLTPAEILSPQPVPHLHGKHSDHSHSHGEHPCHHEHDLGHDWHQGHDHHSHGQDHSHSAEDIFDRVTIRTDKVFAMEELKKRILRLESNSKGTILRAKGILKGPSGYLNVQFIPGDVRISTCTTAGDMLNIIGRNLDRQELVTLFKGE